MNALANSSIWRPSREHWDFFRLLVRRDLATRYAGSTLGAVWNLVHPIAMIGIYVVIFSSLVTGRFGADSRPLDYAAHLCAGLLVWLVFADGLSRCTSVLVDNSNFLKKIWFPPILLHAATIFNVLLVHSAGMLVLLALLPLFGHPVPAIAPAALGLMLAAGIAAMGIGLVLSGLHVFFRDTAQVVAIGLQVGFWFNPVVYPASALEGSPAGDLRWLLAWNPLAHFVGLAQSCLGDPVAAPFPWSGFVVAGFPILCLLLGRSIFRRMVPDIRDSI